ncbi:MAG: hypothetical protein HY791_39605 [Deltaproteobacteria bacterium]|nr:hypothetical protein [Deltaproteobacteria bacterium]
MIADDLARGLADASTLRSGAAAEVLAACTVALVEASARLTEESTYEDEPESPAVLVDRSERLLGVLDARAECRGELRRTLVALKLDPVRLMESLAAQRTSNLG